MSENEFAGLSLVDMLDMLEPIPAPEPISMWPQTVGWIWLGALVIALLFGALVVATRRWRANAYRRTALREIDAACDDPALIAKTLRRAALAAYPRTHVAGLVGDDWLRFLNQTFEKDGFSGSMGLVLARAPYMPCDPAPDLADTARAWIRHHRTKPAPS